MKRAWFVGLLALAGCLSGCVGGPSYAGGPTEADPHGLLVPGEDVSLWRIDGWDVESRGSAAYVTPGRRHLRVRFETPIESEGKDSFEFRELDLDVEAGGEYRLERTGEAPFGPYDLKVRTRRRQE